MFSSKSFSNKSFGGSSWIGLLLYVIAISAVKGGAGGKSLRSKIERTVGNDDRDIIDMIYMIVTSGVLDG